MVLLLAGPDERQGPRAQRGAHRQDGADDGQQGGHDGDTDDHRVRHHDGSGAEQLEQRSHMPARLTAVEMSASTSSMAATRSDSAMKNFTTCFGVAPAIRSTARSRRRSAVAISRVLRIAMKQNIRMIVAVDVCRTSVRCRAYAASEVTNSSRVMKSAPVPAMAWLIAAVAVAVSVPGFSEM